MLAHTQETFNHVVGEAVNPSKLKTERRLSHQEAVAVEGHIGACVEFAGFQKS